MGILTGKGKDGSRYSLFEDNTWNLAEGLNKTTETFSLYKQYVGEFLGATDKRRIYCSWKNIFTIKTVIQHWIIAF
jgi:hypothetical protein